MKTKLLVIAIVIAQMLCLSSCTDSSDAGEPIVLTLGSYGSTVYPEVHDFNNSQDEYVTEVVDYSQDGLLSYEDAVIKLNTDLAVGNGPDIIYFWKLRIDPSLYGRKGYLEDLYPYLDSDPELDRSDFVQPLFEAYEIDGALYQTLPGFGVMTILVPKSVADSISEWTFDDLIDFAEANGGSSPFYNTHLLDSIMQIAVEEFVDFETYTANFDSDYFKSVLEFCKMIEADSIQNDDEGIFRLICMSSFMEIQYFEYVFGEEVGIVGFPSSSGSVSYFSNIMDQYGINSASEHKDAVWQFIRTYFTKEYQEVYSGMLIPSNLDALQALVERSKATIMQEDSEGNLTEFTQRGNFNFEYHAATEEQVQQMLDLIDSASLPARGNSTITSIVTEEAEAYFAGDRSVDEAAQLIQSRVSLYLSEQS